MAERRMFSKKIISSARFLKMPSETQALYFHLSINADDDGIVEAYTTIRLVGATEDSLKILVAKGFVTVLNDDLVTHITDWKEHNLIRADRKVDSIYKDLLLRVIPEAELIKPKERADKKHHGQPMDVQWTPDGQHSIGKVREGEVSIGEEDTRASLAVDVVVEDDFDTFWRHYPKKIGKDKARQAWKKKKDKPSIQQIIASVERYKLSKTVQKGFVCHPTTWINEGRWSDEVEIAKSAMLPDGLSVFDIYEELP